MMNISIHAEMTVKETLDRCPATRAVFGRYGIPTQSVPSPLWETIEQAVAAQGHWPADQLLAELTQATGGQADIQPETSIVATVTTYRATRAIFERYGIPCQIDRIVPWETIEQAAAARGHWVADALLDELNAIL